MQRSAGDAWWLLRRLFAAAAAPAGAGWFAV